MLLGNKVARVEHIKPLNHENSLNITNSMNDWQNNNARTGSNIAFSVRTTIFIIGFEPI